MALNFFHLLYISRLRKVDMCRIAGFQDFNYKANYDMESVILDMRDTLIHGGPDDAGVFISHPDSFALAHRRLSILDLSSSGHQPMQFENLVIVYNGEVYNFKEIRIELENEGYDFKSDSDTEVILKAYHRWRFDCVQKFRGMWAFAIRDKQEKKLILCRDRIGVKPLYWYYQDGLFMFASELKAFHQHPLFKKEINELALSLFLQYGYIKAPDSIFKNVYKLEPGNFLILNDNGGITKYRYWDVRDYFLSGQQKRFSPDEKDIIDEAEKILTESFQLRLVSDVPVGVFLSGGIDSSLVTALLQKNSSKPLKTFTIGFHEQDFNEAHWARKVAEFLETDHTELYCTPEQAHDVLFKLPELYDEPFGDASAIPTHLVSKLAKKTVTVALSADGGDELFYGYSRHWFASKKIPFAFFLKKIVKLLTPDLAEEIYKRLHIFLPGVTNFRERYVKFVNCLRAEDDLEKFDFLCKYFLPEEIKSLNIQKIVTNVQSITLPENLSILQKNSLIDILTYLPDNILVKTDRATMGVALEGREPFLDNKIVEFAAQIPDKIKFKNKTGKYILKQILKRHLPSDIIDRPKQGFDVPVFYWFKNELKDLCYEYILHDNLYFDRKALELLLEDFFERKRGSALKIWFLLVFSMWVKMWM